jgi:Flp pilus assembly protein TadD
MRSILSLFLWLSITALYQHAEAQQVSPSADLVNGIEAYNKGDFESARKPLQAAVDRGEPEAMVNLGYMYARGHGVRSDPAYALQLYRRAADSGDGEGMNAVGYRYNFAPKPDLDQAIHWYRMAVFRGNPRAMNNVAILFYNGQGVGQDRGEARTLWRQAVERGSLNAKTNLGQDVASDATLSAAERLAGRRTARKRTCSGHLTKVGLQRSVSTWIGCVPHDDPGASRSKARLVAAVWGPDLVSSRPEESFVTFVTFVKFGTADHTQTVPTTHRHT